MPVLSAIDCLLVIALDFAVVVPPAFFVAFTASLELLRFPYPLLSLSIELVGLHQFRLRVIPFTPSLARTAPVRLGVFKMLGAEGAGAVRVY
jgi:hypothetical protein